MNFVHRRDLITTETSPSRKLFTLIELLVVIAIISILASMLLPALKKAKETTSSICCKNNLKQIGLVMSMYIDESDEYIPRAWTNYQTWYRLFAPYAGYSSQAVSDIDWNANYGPVGSDGVCIHANWLFNCPVNPGSGNGGSGGTNYGGPINSFTTYFIKSRQVKSPSRWVAIGDVGGNWLEGTPTRIKASYAAWASNTILAEWHMKGGNFTHGDGHVDYYRVGSVSTYQLDHTQ